MIVQSKGFDPAAAGLLNSAFMVLGIVGSLSVPVLAGGRRDLRRIGALMGASYVAGILLLIPSAGPLALGAGIVLCGLCGGTCITYVTMMYALRTRSSGDSSTVSGTSQSVGYLIAAAGPVAAGVLHDASCGWTAPLAMMAMAAVALIALGAAVGRDSAI